jgi:tetratricopeptide (TPR) repeat protein
MDLSEVLDFRASHCFLVGAGISIDSPSCLLSGGDFLFRIARHVSPTPQIFDLLTSAQNSGPSGANTRYSSRLRFETLMSVLRRTVDDGLDILECLSQCSSFNRNHAILAGLLFAGDPVITTNFDVLIERALLSFSQTDPEVILDEQDAALHMSNPRSKPLLKPHGSVARCVAGQWIDARSSIQASLERIGRSGEAFEFAPAFRNVLATVCTRHDLIVLGYSGSDDFDIVPFLRSLRSTHSLFWVDHTPELEPPSLQCLADSLAVGPASLPSGPLLLDLCGSSAWQANRIFHIRAHTATFLQMFESARSMPRPEAAPTHTWDVDDYFSKWESRKLSIPGSKQLVAGQLISMLGRYTLAIELLESAANLLPSAEIELLGGTLYNLASVHTISGAYRNAENICRHAIDILGPTQSRFRTAVFDLLGKVCGYQGNLRAGEAYHRECLRLCTEEKRDAASAASSLHYLGRICQARGDLPEAAAHYQSAMHLYDQIGHIQARALCIHQLGTLFQEEMDFANARKYYEKALGLRERLGDRVGIAASVHQLGCLHFYEGDSQKAIQMVNRSLEIEKELNHLHGVSDSLAFLGYVYTQTGLLRDALRHYEQALAIDLTLGRQNEIAETRQHIDAIEQALRGSGGN